jgi:hypothetical protein
MKRAGLFAVVILAVFMFPALALAGKVAVPEGTKIKVKFDTAARINSGELKAGDTVTISLVEDITVGGMTIVEAGAAGSATIKEAVASSKPGKPGKIVVSFVDLSPKGSYKSKDGGMIKLAGMAEDKGGGRKIISWLFIFGLFIKGGQGEIDTARPYEATVGETIILESK